jgi:hypothetical protein
MLLNKGADVNAQGGDYTNALQAASEQGYEAVVKMLLDNFEDYVLADHKPSRWPTRTCHTLAMNVRTN